MKKIFLTFALAIGATYANSQAITEQDFVREMELLYNKRTALWKTDGSIHGGFNDNGAKLYIQYSIKACALIDQYINQLADGNEQIDILWMKVDILSDALDVYCKNKVGLSESEYDIQFQRMVTALNNIINISNQIDDRHDNLQVIFDAKRELGDQYFKHNNYKEAYDNYMSCINAYQEYANSYTPDTEVRNLGREAYYYLGYSAYKLGDKTTADNYFNKAKSILGTNSLQPYK